MLYPSSLRILLYVDIDTLSEQFSQFTMSCELKRHFFETTSLSPDKLQLWHTSFSNNWLKFVLSTNKYSGAALRLSPSVWPSSILSLRKSCFLIFVYKSRSVLGLGIGPVCSIKLVSGNGLSLFSKSDRSTEVFGLMDSLSFFPIFY
jgi:hypothetical protein